MAEWSCEIGLDPEVSLWDLAALQIIVEEAGGRFTDLRGRDAFETGDALVSNGRIHDQALQVLESRT